MSSIMECPILTLIVDVDVMAAVAKIFVTNENPSVYSDYPIIVMSHEPPASWHRSPVYIEHLHRIPTVAD
ncbi:hypothetical protein HA49_14035 [Tatumella morbirosei]|uniref:Uncharacterized protein n=1 Tax=Tatumella morbirosei TaxID=642227 RepID=A0A095T4T5_9GAMM|nr:hypothetical protein HA49_14035 [Tatumella morbirosei]